MADYTIDTKLSGTVNSDVTADVTADVTSRLAGLDDMTLTLAGGTTTTSSVDTTSKVDSASMIDLRPVALDSCLRLELAPPPETEVCTPYEQRWSWSVLGL